MHKIVYDNASSDWSEALPLGNGVFGAMAYYHEGEYCLALNHYEVYYQHHHRYSHVFQEEAANANASGARDEHRRMLARAERSLYDDGREGYDNYRRIIWPEADAPKQAGLTTGVSHPPTGEISFEFAPTVATESRLSLEIENAAVLLELKGQKCALKAQTKVLNNCDAVITRIEQSEPDLVRSVTLTYPQRRGHEGYSWTFSALDEHTFICRVSFYPIGEDRQEYPPFSFATLYRILGSCGIINVQENVAKVILKDSEKSITLISCVVTELSTQNELTAAAIHIAEGVGSNLPEYEAVHKRYWAEYFQRSNISLPDPVLERLWYLNLYVLGCCSGKNGRRKEQASGLNGLWDIRQPTLWGSLWYWDVNIQATYWPVYTANHLELAETFNDGFLSYMEDGKKRAEKVYGLEGYAIDYPHPFYNCIGPWCAQYLWWYYEYSGDIVFLREKAYPMFREQIRFIAKAAGYDKDRDCLVFFPDVSPEQGPITRNATITIACVKYLLEIALQANHLLNERDEDKKQFSALLNKMPPYSTAVLDRYGEVLKDSELAPPGIPLRHPSLLMPVYPLGELGTQSGYERKIAENTVLFASEHTEIGVFSFGWISAAAARLGNGGMALRILYEQGLDLILRANGMGAEETDRWVNHCAVRRTSLYHPFMMECVGEIINCVNEMLLQSHDGIIRVFPAVPDGTSKPRADSGRERRYQPALHNEPWQYCAFESLLAKGGYEVSAVMKKGEVCWIGIKSTRKGKARLKVPAILQAFPLTGPENNRVFVEEGEGILSFHTEKGAFYQIGNRPETKQIRSEPVLMFPTHLGRQGFIGKDCNTDVIKKLDSFLYDYYIGNDRYRPAIAYRFNFGLPLETIAEADGGVPLAAGTRGPEDLLFLKITPELRFTSYYGFGFDGGEPLKAIDSRQTNYLLRDFVQGEQPTAFKVELPKGRYDILVIAGGAQGVTQLIADNAKAVLRGTKESYAAEIIPVVHNREKPLRIEICTEPGRNWNLNAMVIRKLAAYV